MDTNLPFGLRSAPKNFTALADALSWVFVNRGNISPEGVGVVRAVGGTNCEREGVPAIDIADLLRY